MEDNKPWWQSKTVWGGIVAVLAGIAGAFGIVFDADTQELLAATIAGAIAGGVAIYGRIKATTAVGKS